MGDGHQAEELGKRIFPTLQGTLWSLRGDIHTLAVTGWNGSFNTVQALYMEIYPLFLILPTMKDEKHT
jgi:hypothetical protein